jgi:hypothetical protein
MAAGGPVAAPARMAQVVGEALVGHAVECRRGALAVHEQRLVRETGRNARTARRSTGG